MALTININGLTLCHRGSDGITHNTLPDVCKTPEKGIPLPYENEAYSKDIANGTVTVSADGGNMAAKLGCIFAKSVFDEGGSMGGIISGTHLAEADFITHSFDVFLEGSPACRLTDKMWMNHRNTVNMAGLKQGSLSPRNKQIQDWVCECQDEVKPEKADGTKKTCTELGNERHDCMEKKKKAQNEADEKAGKKPKHGQEKGYKTKDGKIQRTDDIDKRRADNATKTKNTHAEAVKKQRIQEAKARNAQLAHKTYKQNTKRGGGGRSFGGLEAASDAMGEASAGKFFKENAETQRLELEKADKAVFDAEDAMKNSGNVIRHGDHKYPDGSILDENGKITELSEYKFVCDEGNPIYRKRSGTDGPPSKGTSTGPWTPGQEDSYKKLLEAMKNEGLADKNAEVQKYSAADCPKSGGGNGGATSDKKSQPSKPKRTPRGRK